MDITILTEQRANDWIAFVAGNRAKWECADTQNEAYHKLARRLLQERVNELEPVLAALKRLLPLAAEAWQQMDANADEFYSASQQARAAIARAEAKA